MRRFTTMASDTAKGCTADGMTLRADEVVSPVDQELEDVAERLLYLSERITLCKGILKDLKALGKGLEKKSLQDVPLPPQK